MREDPNAPGTLIAVPINGPAIMPLGAWPIGATCPVLAGNRDLRCVTLGPNVLGVSDKPVSSTYCHRGTLAGVYNDTGMFYSTDPATAYAWEVNKLLYDASQPAATYLKVGPWRRIQ